MPVFLPAILAAALLQGAQVETPDFTGVWAMDRSRSEIAAQEQASGDVALTITQTGTSLQVVTRRDGKSDAATYPIGPQPVKLDDVEPGRRAYWQGSSLVSEGSVDIEGQTVSFREQRALAADGSEMVVETFVKMQHGYTMRGAQTMATGRNVYVRGR
jgi:hypothetical protein